MPTPTRHPHRPATVVPLSSRASLERRHRTASAAAARRLHPSAHTGRAGRIARGGDAVVIPFPASTAPPGGTP